MLVPSSLLGGQGITIQEEVHYSHPTARICPSYTRIFTTAALINSWVSRLACTSLLLIAEKWIELFGILHPN